MAFRVAAHLPRLAILVVVFTFAGGTLTYGAAKRLSAPAGNRTVHASTPTLVVPDVTGQAFVFAKGALEDSGFAWHVIGSVHGYAANTVVSQTPAAGTKVKDTGAPTITVALARSAYAEAGEPEDISPYAGTAVVLPSALVAAKPALQRPALKKAVARKAVVPKRVVHKTVVPNKVAKRIAQKKPAVRPKVKAIAKQRPPAFAVSGAPKEPVKEMPLSDRAQLLSSWLSSHTEPTSANVRHFLYQNSWVVTGARFGWWHGTEALRLLIAADVKAQRLWGVGHKSELAARNALAEVKARSR